MDFEFSDPAHYPVRVGITTKGVETDLGVGVEARGRLSAHLQALVGFDNKTKVTNPITDPRDKDISTVLAQYKYALAALEAIATGVFPSTDENPQYAGGVVSPGNRIYTPAEAAKNALEAIKRIEAAAS